MPQASLYVVLRTRKKKENIYISIYAYNTKMTINQIIMGLGIVLGIYIMYKLFFTRIKVDDDYQKVYNKVLTSEEYKVKGQYDK
jgi:hypothetical protein|tara:strand:+ start:127 stop:378 length:252 start_codon:yes stop_codon:yes gene_type:complete